VGRSPGRRPIHVSLFAETLGRNSFHALLDADVQPTTNGGAAVVGFVGLAGSTNVVLVVILGVGSIILGTAFVAGVVNLTRSQGGWPLIVVPLIFVVFLTLLLRSGRKTLTESRPKLMALVQDIIARDKPA
jgi:hypothetical protein